MLNIDLKRRANSLTEVQISYLDSNLEPFHKVL